jgi:hypothetical protein
MHMHSAPTQLPALDAHAQLGIEQHRPFHYARTMDVILDGPSHAITVAVPGLWLARCQIAWARCTYNRHRSKDYDR